MRQGSKSYLIIPGHGHYDEGSNEVVLNAPDEEFWLMLDQTASMFAAGIDPDVIEGLPGSVKGFDIAKIKKRIVSITSKN